MEPGAASPGRLILGLGNPGDRYRETRHNLGFRTVEELARRWKVSIGRLECGALVGIRGAPDDRETRVTLAKPQTYMNRSGYAARCLVERHGFAAEDLLVVYDELALPLGRLRLRAAGSPGGHRGMESVLDNLRTDRVPRLRLGIAPEGGESAFGEEQVDFVLAPFAADERETVEAMVLRAADACEAWIEEGVDAAMGRFNG